MSALPIGTAQKVEESWVNPAPYERNGETSEYAAPVDGVTRGGGKRAGRREAHGADEHSRLAQHPRKPWRTWHLTGGGGWFRRAWYNMDSMDRSNE